MKFFKKNAKKKIGFIILVSILLFIIVRAQAPSDFPSKSFEVAILKGTSLSDIAINLKNKNVIKSKLIFKLSVSVLSRTRGVLAGDYRFNYPQNTISTAYRMVKGKQGQNKLRIVIPEGTNVNDMAFIFLKSLSDFNAPHFVALAKRYEGYLYPDTYYFLENARPEEIIRTMKDNFDEKIASIKDEIEKFDKPLNDIIVMASLVEKEAYADDSRKIVAGILWKRLDNNMFLQVDAPFYFITGKKGNFSLDDLKIDSPYNTYVYKDLPRGPISNPSINTILDTIMPKKTSYYFYLTGKDGSMRYAETFDEHIANKNMYLR